MAETSTPSTRVVGLVLAAGAGRRFGAQKLLHDVAGAPLVRHTVRALLGTRLDALVVVVGSEGARVRAALEDLPVRIVEAERWGEGMSRSLRTGVDALPHDAAAALVALGDQPGVSAAIVDPLVGAFLAGHGPIVAPSYDGEWGPPVLFARALFDELRAVEGDRGGRPVVMRDPARVSLVPLARAPLEDVDRPEDLASLPDLRAGS